MLKRERQFGFTLTETMIAVSILGILAAMAIPSFTAILERRKIIAVAEAIESDFHWARGEAIKRNADVTVTFTDGDGGAWSYTINPGSKTVNSALIDELNDIGLSTNFSSDNTTFDHIRGAANKAGSVTLTSPGNYRLQVRVGVMGRARICYPAGATEIGGYSPC